MVKYFINQRFIVGARYEDEKNPGHFKGGQVYRITAIDKDYNLSTWNSEDVGLIKLYVFGTMWASSPTNQKNKCAKKPPYYVLTNPSPA